MRCSQTTIRTVNGLLSTDECSRIMAAVADGSFYRSQNEAIFARIEQELSPDLALSSRAVFQVMLPGSLCQRHTDTGIEPRAVCSVSLLLEDCDAGGVLIVAGNAIPRRHPGDASYYSSALEHEVSLVESGRRVTLIFWAGRRRNALYRQLVDSL
jgi:hypothetical protein